MIYSLVRFTDGVFHVASSREIINKDGNQVSVYWKSHRTYYLANILQKSTNKKSLIKKKLEYEKDELEEEEERCTDIEKLKKLQVRVENYANKENESQQPEKCTGKSFNKEESRWNTSSLVEGEKLKAKENESPRAEKPAGLSLSTQNLYIADEIQGTEQRTEDETFLDMSRCEELYSLLNETQSKRPCTESRWDPLRLAADEKLKTKENESPRAEKPTELSLCTQNLYITDDIQGTEQRTEDETFQDLSAFGKLYSQLNEIQSEKQCTELRWNTSENKSPSAEKPTELSFSTHNLYIADEIQGTEESFNSKDKPARDESNFQTNISPSTADRVIWEELGCDIPYNRILEFEDSFCNRASDITILQPQQPKINIISVETILPTNNDNKGYNKKPQFCFFCHKLVNRFGRHLTTVHRQEDEVITIISLEKKSLKRKILIDKLRTKGNYIYNHGNFNSGSSIVARRPVNRQCPAEYMDCPNCFIRISKVSLRRHVRKCNDTSVNGRRTTQVDSKRVTFHLHKIADTVLKEQVFPVLKNDLVTQVLREDHLAILYGNKLVAKYSSSHHHKMIRSNLRYIGKYLIEMRKLSSDITDFKSCFSPLFYDLTVKAIRKVAGYNEDKGEYRAPFSASAIGTILKFCCAILEAEHIKKENTEKIASVQNFLKLLQTELGTDINKTVIENLTTLRRSRKVVLPTSSDMSKLINHVRLTRDQLLQELHKEFSFEVWKKLASYTLVGVMTYNGRRPGEIERLLVSDFKESSQSHNENSESLLNTNNINYTRCVLRGKLGRNVSVILSEEEVNSIKCILDQRELAGVNVDNPYVFGLPGKKPFKFLKAGLLLKEIKQKINVEHPERLFATNIRKNLATKSSKLSLNAADKDHIMEFMGHSEKIHKNIYRQPDMEKDITVMPMVLDFAAGNERGTIITETEFATENNLEGENIEDRMNVCEYTNSYDKSDEIILPKRKRRLIDMSLGYVPRKSWSTEERVAARDVFKKNIETGQSPSYEMCKKIIKKCEALKSRSPAQVKAWINFQIKQNTSKSKERERRSWTTPEKKLMREVFGEDVERGVYPNRKNVIEVIHKYPQLQGRTPEMVISHLQHAIKKSCETQ